MPVSAKAARPGTLSASAFLIFGALLVACFFAAALSLPGDRYLRFQQLKDTEQYRAQWIYERIHFDPTPIDVAILGPSRSLFAVNGPRLERDLAALGYPGLHVVNFSLPDDGYDLVQALAKELVKYRRPKVMVVSISEQPSRKSHPAFKELADSWDIVRSPLDSISYLENLVRAAYRQIALALVQAAPGFFGQSLSFDPSRYAGPSVDTTVDVRLPDGQLVDHSSVKSLSALETDRARFLSHTHAPLLGGRVDFLEFAITRFGIDGIAKAARAAHAKLYFLYQGYYRGPREPYDKALYTSRGTLLSGNAGMDDYRLFVDSRHRNHQGAVVLTDALADQLAADWKKDPRAAPIREALR